MYNTFLFCLIHIGTNKQKRSVHHDEDIGTFSTVMHNILLFMTDKWDEDIIRRYERRFREGYDIPDADYERWLAIYHPDEDIDHVDLSRNKLKKLIQNYNFIFPDLYNKVTLSSGEQSSDGINT